MVIKLNFVQTLGTRFGQEFEVEVQAKLLKLKFGQYFAAEAWKAELNPRARCAFGNVLLLHV